MAKLISSAICSLDGYVADEAGRFDWAEPAEDVHAHLNELERSIGTYLYGRRMYEVLKTWETFDLAGQPAHIRDWAEIWRAADKIVHSTTLEDVSTERTRLERSFDPEAIRGMKASAGADLSVGGPTLAAEAFRAGLVDEVHLYLVPFVVGGGTRALPDGVRAELELLDERRFGDDTVFLGYRVRA